MEHFVLKKKKLVNWGEIFCLVLLLVNLQIAHAEVRLPNIINSNMVLQQMKKAPIWGKANPGEKVEVEFDGKLQSCVTREDGTWRVNIKVGKASFEPKIMVVKGEKNEIRLTNILVGEVWLCGGQSNMEYPMDRTLKRYLAPKRGHDVAAEELKKESTTEIRLFMVEKKYGKPDCVTLGWQIADKVSRKRFSAVAYFYGKSLQEQLNVPVGIIASSWGGSRIENWMSEDSYKKSDFYSKEKTSHPDVKRTIARYYNTMIKPLAPFAVKGFIWYQGESDAIFHDSLYVDKFGALLTNWRTIFENKKLPMYFVQIAPHLYSKRHDKYKHDEYLKATFSDQQTECLDMDRTGQVIVTDLVDNPKDIHPSYKWEVGRRLSLFALKNDYKIKHLVCSGPSLKKVKEKKGKLLLYFDSKGSGLTSGRRDRINNKFFRTNEKLSWFEVADENGNFKKVDAVVLNNHVELDVKGIKAPLIVRFGWNESAMPNLFNTEGLPAVPFQYVL